MGSFSVYCEISRITISERNDCVLLPLIKSSEYRPVLLPIYGKYNDYGDIEVDSTTLYEELIQKHFKMSLQEFCDGLTHNSRTITVLKNIDYCWIDRQVWDYLTTQWLKKPALYYGSKELLTYLGFTYIGEEENPKIHDSKRYKYKWQYKDKFIFSDSNWIYSNEGKSLHSYNDGLLNYVNLDPDKIEFLKNKSNEDLIEINTDDQNRVNLFPQYRADVTHLDLRFKLGLNSKGSILWSQRNEYLEESIQDYTDEKDPLRKYYQDSIDSNNELVLDFEEDLIINYRLYADELLKIVKLKGNLWCGSYKLEPYASCITPQCGEYDVHSKLLSKFVEINNSYINKDNTI